MPRCRAVSVATSLAVVILAGSAGTAWAQTGIDPARRLFRPVIDGDPEQPQRFTRAPAAPAAAPPGQFGAPRPFGSPPESLDHAPGYGAGDTGFLSTNVPRTRPRARTAVVVPAPSRPIVSSRPGQPTVAAAPQTGFPLETPGTIRRRPPPPETDAFAPLGLRTGSFLVRPAVEFWGGYDSNPGRSAGGRGSWLATVAPELQVRSDWSRHQLNADLRAT